MSDHQTSSGEPSKVPCTVRGVNLRMACRFLAMANALSQYSALGALIPLHCVTKGYSCDGWRALAISGGNPYTGPTNYSGPDHPFPLFPLAREYQCEAAELLRCSPERCCSRVRVPDRTPLVPLEAAMGKAPVAPTGVEPGRYLVGFDGEAAISSALLAASGGRIVDSIPAQHVLVIDRVTAPEALRNAGGRYVEAGFDLKADPIISDDAPVTPDFAVPGAGERAVVREQDSVGHEGDARR